MTPPCPAPFNMARYVLEAGADRPDRIALAVLGPSRAERWSHARLRAAVLAAAAGLRDAGLSPGDRVLLRLGNRPSFPVVFLGAIAAGLVPVASSAQLTEPEITAMSAEVAPRLVVAEAGIALPRHAAPVRDPAELDGDAADFDWQMGHPDRPAYIVFTSGTAGAPRAVLHAHRAIWARRSMAEGWTGIGPGDRVLHAGAFNWTYTLGTGLLDPWSRGATALIPAEGTAAEALPLLLKRHDATVFAAVPGLYRRLLRAGLPPLPRLRHGLSAGEPLPETTRAAWRAATGTDLHQAYGLSECSTFVSGSPDRPAPPGTMGHAQPGRRVALRLGGAAAPDGEAGIIAVHRDDPGLMLGYLGHPDETASRFDGDWFLTGDMARPGPDGALVYEGRQDDMMNAGGYRVSPVEVEEALSAHPDVTDAAACELRVRPDASVVGLFYTGRARDEADLVAHAEARLARYKRPRLYIHMTELPRGANGKLLRRRLKDDWEAEMVKLDILSDPICPWCYIGKTQLDRALEAAGNPFAIEWHPFQLNPDMPAGGMDRRDYLRTKFGEPDGGGPYAEIAQHARKAGLEIDFAAIERVPNTIDAHRLIHWAGIEQRQTLVVQRLFEAYFKEGRDIGDHETLADIADGAEMDAGVVMRLLASDADVEDIRRRDAHSREMGVTGVPTFIVGGRHAVPGAQPPDLWAKVIAEIEAGAFEDEAGDAPQERR